MVLPPLTSDEQTALNGASTRRTCLSVISDDDALITTLTVNQSVIPFPLTQLTVTGTITDVTEGMEAVVSRSGAEIGRYRVRLDAITATLYLMEQGRADAGALAYLLRQTGISNGDTIKIYDRRNLYSVLPRIVLSDPETLGSIYEDYDRVPGIEQSFPSPIANMRVNTSRGGYFATRVLDGATVAISATVTVLRWPTSTSETFAWTVPGAWTGVSGTSSATLTGTAPIGNWKLECTITPNVGPAFTIVRRVHIHGITENPPILLMDGTFSGSRDRTGRRMTFSLNDDRITSIPHTSMVMAFNDGTWNGSASSVPTATRIFTGWMNRIGLTVEQQTRQAAPEIIGPAGILDVLGNNSQLFEGKNLATTWQEMTYPLSTVSWVVWWLMRRRAANLLQLFNYWPISTASDVGRLPSFNVPSGSLLSQLKGVARRYHEANFGFNSGGEAFVRVHPSMTPVDDREDPRDVLTPNKYSLPLNWDRALRPSTRQVQGGAYTWDGASPLPTPLRSDAPEKPGQGTADDTWQDQIVDTQENLNVLTGLRYALLNNPIPQAPPFTIPHNRDVYEPAEMPRVEAVIPANKMPTGEEWDFFGVPISVADGYLPNGATQITLTLEPETSGDKGVTIPIAPPGSNLNPDLPPVDEIPFQPVPDIDWGPDIDYDPDTPTPLNPQPGAPAEYGRMLSATSDNRVQRLTWPSGTFTLADVSPSANFRALLGTAFKLHRDEQNPKQAFLVGNKAILRCADWTTATPKWSAPSTLATGIFDVDNGDGTHTLTFDFTKSQCGFTLDRHVEIVSFAGDIKPDGEGLDYVAGQGWRTANMEERENLGYYRHRLAVGRFVQNGIVARAVTINWTPSGVTTHNVRTSIFINGTQSPNGYQIDTPRMNGTGTFTYNPTDYVTFIAGDVLGFWLVDEPNDSCAPCISIVNSIQITYETAPPPFAFSQDDIVSDFKSSPCRDRQNAYYWFIKRPESGTDYLWLKRTFDNFRSTSETRIARYSTDIVPTITIDPHNWKFVYVTAGDPAEDDCYLYESADGGGAFNATSVAILAKGGQICWNWSTGTPNAHNNSKDNLIIVRGLDGSNNLLARRGVGGSDVTIATGSGKYGLSPQALWVLAKDLDFVRLALQDNSLRLSSNAAGSFSGGTAVPGGSSNVARGLDAWPTGEEFNMLWGYRTLCFTTDAGSSYTDLWSDFDTFRSATYTSDNETIIGVVIDISSHYTTPVLGGG